MEFITKYLEIHSGTAVPKQFHIWSALSIIAMTAGRKVFVDYGHFQIFPGIYVCLVGEPASKKSSAMVAARDLFTEVFPDYPSGVSITSREDIIKFMSSDACLRQYTDHNEQSTEYRPLANFINEFTNWLSFNPGGMIEFLTDIYDTKFFASSTIARGKEFFLHPYLSILACTVPKNIIKYLKSDVISGGFSRRIIFVYVTETPPKITFPGKPVREAEEWCKAHLLKISKLAGEFTWASSDVRNAFDKWYVNSPPTTDTALSGYYESKDQIVQKLAMCLALSYPEPKLEFTKDTIEGAIALLDQNEINLPKLTIAIGRNELAVPQQKLMDILRSSGGQLAEYKWHKLASSDFTETEYIYTKKMLKETLQIFEVMKTHNGRPMATILLDTVYKELVLKGELK